MNEDDLQDENLARAGGKLEPIVRKRSKNASTKGGKNDKNGQNSSKDGGKNGQGSSKA